MDKLGQMSYNSGELVYLYKGKTEIPTLQMVDDILAIQKCSLKSKKINTVINTFIDLETFTLSSQKCSVIYVGNDMSHEFDLKILM